MFSTLSKTATQDDEGKRFDHIARFAFNQLPLSVVHKAIRKGDLRLNGKKAKGDKRIIAGDILSYRSFNAETNVVIAKIERHKTSPCNLNILYENENFLVLNKPVGLLVHDKNNSLQQQVEAYLPKNTSLSFRPSPCHRLDRNTSGVLVFAKTATGARLFATALQQNQLQKLYWALLCGQLKQPMEWVFYLKREGNKSFVHSTGQKAVTFVKPLHYSQGFTLVECQLETGRTHQIRASAQAAGYPLYNDLKYGAKGTGEIALHAYTLVDDTGQLFPPLKAEIPLLFYNKLIEKGFNLQYNK